ncbi:hypothetical protein [Paenibacillus planticolens]|uniref:Uncharacterized protein n=1 Tax=Paenibacillus planticolens TaxID=2654976 RepID=A0ABX1ZEQ9_9BACL|nr:hypothetical protein [Paenibacillus planticolens]NOU98588.1 hypothetical protein [Paenibacillus planticolens]
MSNFISEMNFIKEKPALYLGKKNFTILHGFIHGFSHAEFVYKIVEEYSNLFPLPFHFFHEYVRVKLGYHESTSGWYNMIFEKNNYDEETSFDEFFRFYEEFNNLKIQNCVSSILSDENIYFHINDQSTPKRWIGFDENGNSVIKPLFSNPEKILLMKLSNNLGYLRVILTQKECFLVLKFSQHKKKSTEYFHMCFGEKLNWIKDKWDDGMLNNRKIVWTSSNLMD